ncbi:MAG TPA: hypothetical protein VMK32_10350 [Burkholderiaceae bacterium]|nr:hypothetical protein [Burkholderiaceae bacterium]
MTPQSASGSGHAEHAGSFRGAVRATLWPTRSLVSTERWFDELYIWTEGGAASTTQRAQIQIEAMNDAFQWLDYDLVGQIGLTISFGTIERALDPLTELFEKNALLAHRMFVLLRGAPQRLRSRYRLRAFADMLRGLRIAVGYRLTAPRVSMELTGVDLVQPIFAKVLAPNATRPEAWSDLALEIRALGLDTRTTIVGALETAFQRDCAVKAGFELGQGRAVRLPYPPPTLPTKS